MHFASFLVNPVCSTIFMVDKGKLLFYYVVIADSVKYCLL